MKLSPLTSQGSVDRQAHDWRAVAAVMLGVALSSLDTAIANTALPTIAGDLHASPATSVWIINAYQIAIVATVLPLAALGDIIGHRRIFIAGLSLFTLSSLVCALASTLPLLAAARTLQGLGASGIMSVNIALLRFIYPPDRLGRGVGLNALTVGFCFSVGPTVASLILSIATWPWLFGINVPLGLLALLAAAPSLPHSPLGKHRFDAIAALLNVVMFTTLIFALGAACQHEPAAIWGGSLGMAMVFGALLIRRERDNRAPILPIDLYRVPIFALSAATSICSFAVQGLAFVALPFFFEGVLHRSQVQTGFLLAPWSIVVALTAPVAGRLSDRYSPAVLGGIGLLILTLGMTSLALLPADPGVADIVIRLLCCGVGFGFFQSPNMRALMSAAPPSRSGGASGTIATSRLLGQTLGAALTALCFNFAGGVQGASIALWMGAAFALAACIASLARTAV
ncbi:MFS transporter [Pararobbsia silviterrae]|uniref:MFS transporter n=1 Tax=Pararobbsia silviterrae TaxID=1792498 RepID=A0A494WYQ4_9BURK|nr:MFS transporter [Pararobbsia silviterrae]RKP43655.1 MFS transporter [Pararobbsia silviterrae]